LGNEGKASRRWQSGSVPNALEPYIETLREMFEETLKDFHFAENGIVNAAQEG